MTKSKSAVPKTHDWEIQFKCPTMWRGWRGLITIYRSTKQEAAKYGKSALGWYEGTTQSRVTMVRKNKRKAK